MILSPSTLSKIHHNLGKIILPTKSYTVLKTVANLGLIYATFIQALQVDPNPIFQTKVKRLCLSLFVFILPFMVGYTLYYVAFQRFINKEATTTNEAIGITSIYWGITITATGFATLAPILTKLKLLCTRVGQEALKVGSFNNLCTWGLINLTLAISTSPNYHNYINVVSTCSNLLFMVLYMVFCYTVIKPAILKMTINATEGENNNNFAVQMILFMVLGCGVLMDYLGSHFIFGSYILGRSVPPGIIANSLIEKMEGCVDGVLMPLYFMSIGIKIDIITLFQNIKYAWILALAVATKVVCTLVIGLVCNIPLADIFPLGVLLSAKGLLPLALLNIGLERRHITGESFGMSLLIILISTMLVGPIMSIGHKLIRKSNENYDQRIIEGAPYSEELRLMTCIHTSRNIPSIINLLEISNITTNYPALLHVTHLVELQGNASAMLIEHESRDSFFCKLSSKLQFNRARVQSDKIIRAFDEFKETNKNSTSVKIFTVVSPIDSMHEDIVNLAANKQTSLIILPFHKQQGIDGKLQVTNVEFGGVNKHVLEMAPCSVALLVDRGLRVFSLSSVDHSFSSNGSNSDQLDIAMLFIGGPDDREALTYAWRMASHPFVNLTVIQFLEGRNLLEDEEFIDYLKWFGGYDKDDILVMNAQNQREQQVDNEFLFNFQEKIANDESICYLEMVVNKGEEIIPSLKEMDHDFDLYIVGRGEDRFSVLTIGLDEWCECKELGPLGNTLVTSEFTSSASLLVMQQYPCRVDQTLLEENASIEEDRLFISPFQQP